MASVYKNLHIQTDTSLNDRNTIFYKLKNKSMCIKSEILIHFPKYFNQNVGNITVMEYLYESIPFFFINKIQNKNFLSNINNFLNYIPDLRDLCIKKGEVVQSINLTLLSYNKKSNNFNYFLSLDIFLYTKLSRTQMNRNSYHLFQNLVLIRKNKLKYFIEFIELVINKKTFTHKNKNNNISFYDSGIVFYIKNKYFKKRVESYVENFMQRNISICYKFITFLSKSFKLEKLKNKIINFYFKLV